MKRILALCLVVYALLISQSWAQRNLQAEVQLRTLMREQRKDLTRIQQFDLVKGLAGDSLHALGIIRPERRAELRLTDGDIDEIVRSAFTAHFDGFPLKTLPTSSEEVDPGSWGRVVVTVDYDEMPDRGVYAYHLSLVLMRLNPSPASKWANLGRGRELSLSRFGCVDAKAITPRLGIEKKIDELMAQAAAEFLEFHE